MLLAALCCHQMTHVCCGMTRKHKPRCAAHGALRRLECKKMDILSKKKGYYFIMKMHSIFSVWQCHTYISYLSSEQNLDKADGGLRDDGHAFGQSETSTGVAHASILMLGRPRTQRLQTLSYSPKGPHKDMFAFTYAAPTIIEVFHRALAL